MTTTTLVVCLVVVCAGLILVPLVGKRPMRASMKVWKLFSFSLDTRERRPSLAATTPPSLPGHVRGSLPPGAA